jgi:acetyl-CoA synthetase
MVITSDGGYRGNKTIELKSIIDEALLNCPCVANVLVVKKESLPIEMKGGRPILQTALDEASDNNVAEIMDAEDPYSSFTPLDQLVNQKAWYIPQLDIWSKALYL